MEIKLGKYDLELHSGPLAILQHFTQFDKKSHESGGIILGKLFDSKIKILKLSVPTSLDRSSRANFERSKLSAQIVLDYEFFNSHGQLTYLGEWHTHPEPYPKPSRTDLKMLDAQYLNNSIGVDFVILIIKGTKGIYLRIKDLTGFTELEIDY